MALIYKLYVDEEEKDERCYIGSTTQIMRYRLYEHFRPANKCASNILINQYGKNKIKYIILEECKATNRKAREKYWIQNTENTLNKCLPYESENERKERSYKLHNRKYNCDCGSIINRGDISKHIKTKKHQAYLNQLNSFTPVCTVEAASATQIHTDNQALSS